MYYFVFFFFFQAEDGIRDADVTGVQTCALPIFIEKKEATTFSQGGTYEQYRRWFRAYPDLFHIQSLNAFVVRRSRGDDGPSSQTRYSEQDHGAGALRAEEIRAL